MERRTLKRTDIDVSRLGFGCVQLTSHQSIKKAVDVLECAYASGITHFDVARLYGFGRAEGILSYFLEKKRDRITVATKFGFDLPTGFSGNPKLISFAKKILKPFPAILHRAKRRGALMIKEGNFSPDQAIKSLEKSLQALRTDYIDIFLLHEATLYDAQNDDLIAALQQQVAKGTIRSFGIASDFEKFATSTTSIPTSYSILQFNDSAIDQQHQTLSDSLGIITHSIFKPFETIIKATTQQPAATKHFAATTGIDLFDPDIISALLLHYALQANPEGVVLFSSMNPRHIEKNCRMLEYHDFSADQLIGFCEFIKMLFSKNPGNYAPSSTEAALS